VGANLVGRQTRSSWFERWLSSVALTLALCSCGTATIERRSGPDIVGRIDVSDANYLYVSGTDYRYLVARPDVLDISHPGTLSIVFGGICAGLGAMWLGASLMSTDSTSSSRTNQGSDWSGMALVMGIAALAAGLPLLLHGRSVRARSVQAAAPPSSSRE
jgi:hypothetical protein